MQQNIDSKKNEQEKTKKERERKREELNIERK